MPGTMRKRYHAKDLGPKLLKCRPDITMEPVDKFLTKMYHTNSHFVFTVTPDFVRHCQTPVLIRPHDIPLPSPWRRRCQRSRPKGICFSGTSPRCGFPLAMRQIRSFLLAASARFCLRRRPYDSAAGASSAAVLLNLSRIGVH